MRLVVLFILSPFRGVSWKELKLFIQENMDEKSRDNIMKSLSSLRSSTEELIGNEENVELIDEASIFLLRLFLNEKIVMMKHLSQMKKMFGQIQTSVANKICSVSFCSGFDVLLDMLIFLYILVC